MNDNIRKFASCINIELLNGVSPEIIAEKINRQDFTHTEKLDIIDYLYLSYYANDYEMRRIKRHSTNAAFLDLVSEIKKKIIL